MAIKNFEHTPHKIEKNWDNAQKNQNNTIQLNRINQQLQEIHFNLKQQSESGREILNLTTDWVVVNFAEPFGAGFLYAYANWKINIDNLDILNGIRWNIAYKFPLENTIEEDFRNALINMYENAYIQEQESNYILNIGFLWENAGSNRFIEDFEVKLILTAWNPIVIV